MVEIPAPEYRHELGNGLYLDVFSLTPEINSADLKKLVESLDGTADIKQYSSATKIIPRGHINKLSELEIEVSDKVYSVPKPLQSYREAVGQKWDSEGKFNGPVMIVDGEVKVPLRVMQGGYYDYAATRLTAQPAELLPERYEKGETVEDVLIKNQINLEERARYFGVRHLMMPSEKKELFFVQRAKGMGIDADCMSLSGSTPDLVLKKPGLKKEGFGIKEWWSHHFAEEMDEEFKLQWGDFWLEGIHFFDDKRLIPFAVAEIVTAMPTKEIAKGAYGKERVLKEHSILYSMALKAIPDFLEKFPISPAIYESLQHILNEGKLI